ncbi:hypothetical protein Zm00014a_002098 [Zea mays]|uniref:Uncharacterized protein n=1 Tax=Zea mays TaxID=4577 RepID=A0A3L6EV43_MAIZE|nr:hypothetical protein Zm00014a_002098 [Zea mays]
MTLFSTLLKALIIQLYLCL